MLVKRYNSTVRRYVMKNTVIAFTAPNEITLEDRTVEMPTGTRVLTKIEYSAISSGTERANLSGDPTVSPYVVSDKAVFPRYCGYSSSGTVLAVGENVKSVKVGDRVALSWSLHERYCVSEEFNVHKIESPDLPLEVASLTHIATFPLAAIRKCALEIGESAMVMGLGVLGLIAVMLLRTSGAYPVIAVDPVESKRARALELGADYALDPFDPDFAERVRDICGGVKVAIEVTGNGKALDMALDCMARFGRVALLGCTRSSDFTIDYYRKVHATGVSLIGAHTLARPSLESSHGMWTHHDDANAILGLIKGGRLDLGALIDEIHPVSEAHTVYDRLVNNKSFPTVIFDWSDVQ